MKPLLAKVQADVIEGLPDPTHDARAVDSITASSNSDGAQLPGQAGPATLKKRGSSFASSSPFRSASATFQAQCSLAPSHLPSHRLKQEYGLRQNALPKGPKETKHVQGRHPPLYNRPL